MSKIILTPVDKATKAIIAAETSLTKAYTELSNAKATLADEVVKTSLALEFKQSELSELEDAAKIKARENKVELDLLVKENETKVVDNILKSHGKVAISIEEYNNLTNQVKLADEEFNSAVTMAVEKEVANIRSSAQAQVSAEKSKYQIDTAEMKAELTSANARVELYKEQLEEGRKTLEEERKARVAIAEAASKAQAVTVNTAK